MAWYGTWRPYVPVARRRAKAATFAAKLAKKENRQLCPVKIQGRKIASTFWGQAWCDNLEAYSDFSNRLPRGRTYARNGSVIDLNISRGKIKSIVSGSDIYHIEIEIAVLKKELWKRIKRECSNTIDSLLDLLQGRFDQGVMQRLSQPNDGLFPQPAEIKLRCSCPDWAGLCKHLAATLYGVGARLDHSPELLFLLRGVDHRELVGEAVGAESLERALGPTAGAMLKDTELSEIFGIDIDRGSDVNSTTSDADKTRSRKSSAKTANRRTMHGRQPTPRKKKTESSSTMNDKQSSRESGKRTARKSTGATNVVTPAKETKKRATTKKVTNMRDATASVASKQKGATKTIAKTITERKNSPSTAKKRPKAR